jgi:hypothetical protein
LWQLAIGADGYALLPARSANGCRNSAVVCLDRDDRPESLDQTLADPAHLLGPASAAGIGATSTLRRPKARPRQGPYPLTPPRLPP